jgi:hypothetical protein
VMPLFRGMQRMIIDSVRKRPDSAVRAPDRRSRPGQQQSQASVHRLTLAGALQPFCGISLRLAAIGGGEFHPSG